MDDVYVTPEGNGKVIYDSVRCSWLTNECGSASDPGGAPVNFINLPNGQVLAAAGSRNWVYTPVGSPRDAWRPTVTSITNSGTTYHLTGRPGEVQTTDFTLPTTLADGTYTLYVSACGVSSGGVAFTF